MASAKKTNKTAAARLTPGHATLKALIGDKRLKARSKPDPAMAAVRAVVAASCAPDVVAFFDIYASYQIRELGLWRLATPQDMIRKPASSALFDPAAIAVATSTLYLGKDGSGSEFYVQRAETLSEVFIHDPGAGQFAFLASSLTAFVELNDLVARWDDLCEAEDADPDPEAMSEGDIDFSKPAFATLRARAKALKGRVSLVTGSDFDETVCALAEATLRAKSASDVASIYKRWKKTKLGRP